MRIPAILRSRYVIHAGLAAAGLVAGVLLFDAIMKRPEIAAWLALEGKRSVAKFVLFDVAERERGEYLELRPGRYTFELFLKASGWLAPRLECSFEHLIDEKQIEEYRSDATVYLINYNITLP